MKSFLRYALAALALVFASITLPAPAQAVDCTLGTPANTCYWIPGSGAANWSATTNWSLTSGGVSCVCSPATGQNVVFDANSGTNTSTMDAAISLATFDASASTALTFTQSANTLTITGTKFALNSTIVYAPSTATRAITFTLADGVTSTLTSAGHTLGNVTVNGNGGSHTGGVQLAASDPLTLRSDATLTLTAGVFDANNNAVNAGAFESGNNNTRTLTMGSGIWTMACTTPINSGNIFNLGNTSNGTFLTLTANTAALILNGTGFNQYGIETGNKSLNALTLKTSTGVYYFNNTNYTFSSITIEYPNNIVVQGTTTLVVTGAVNWSGGDNSHWALLKTNAAGAAATLQLGATSTMDHTALFGMTITSHGLTVNNGIDYGGNGSTGGGSLTINPPASGGGGHIIGG